jgi:predicted Zn-dependent protease with MMP-like domain
MIPRGRFERLVRRALAGLPPEFRARLENVDVIVERRPRQEHLRAAGVPPGETLLGLYVGTPLTERSSGSYHLTLPDRIYIFQEPIERMCGTAREVVHEVRRTVMHELAHHFGITDDRLAQLGLD